MLWPLPDMDGRAPNEKGGADGPVDALVSTMRRGNRAETPAVSNSASGRHARFRTIYHANYHVVLGYALRRTASRDDAEDVVADTFLAAWRRLERVPVGPEARLWLYGVARKALANQRRGAFRWERLSRRAHAELALSPPTSLADQEGDRVAAAFARLSDGERELLALVAWEGLDPGEIAAVLGCSRNAARIRLHRARRRFVRALQPEPDELDGSTRAGSVRSESLISAETESRG
jgi:RNA polymerase sigma-70 factor (ECF subfamily)